MAVPRIALAPTPAPRWAEEAVLAGGGRLVPPDEAEALVWIAPPGREAELGALLAPAPGIRWIQLPWAGIEDFRAAGLVGDDRTWTCAKGIYAEPVAEHALALALAGLRHLPDRVRATSWGPRTGRTLFDGRVVVVGGGGIAASLLALLAPFRTETIVVRRTPAPLAGAARVVGLDALHAVLSTADIVVLAAALTPETEALIGKAELSLMRPHAWLVNVARGRHVVTDDLVAALEAKEIGGAALDVTDPEPLPEGHPLWQLPNCIITPHCANTAEMVPKPLGARIRENVRRFAAGEELEGLVDPRLGY